ncbi:twin-arginine translocase TatA/TatE family subunit [Microbacterium deminutum]|uniref:twin-arginine translocase TatA/TatE family subunit n=1 Tax=Microbacterium deminutum TaxID=344164 RepID=UPI0031D37C57
MTFEKLLLLGVIAALIFGPDRLPTLAAHLGRAIGAIRGFTETAKARAREELGDDYDAIDWKRLDPRQYDPRHIVRQALTQTSEGTTSSPSTRTVSAIDGMSSPTEPVKDPSAHEVVAPMPSEER